VRAAALSALLVLSGCRLLASSTPCVSDDNCLSGEVCNVSLARCVRLEATDPGGGGRVDAGAPVDAGATGFSQRQR
jgi:hypothetical protein